MRAIRRTRPEAALLLPNSFRSALATWLAKVPRRVGYARDRRSWLLTAPVPWDLARRPVAAVDYYAELARLAFGCDLNDRSVELWRTDEEVAAADRLLEGVTSPFIVLNPGANRQDKRWPVERFAEAARWISRAGGLAIVVNGSPGERALVDDLCALCGESAINLAARGVTLGSLKEVLHRGRLLITNDTGPRHIAAAVDTPAVVLFGPTDHRWTTLPGARERLLVAEPFLPEDRVADDAPALCSIERIAVSDVVRASALLLAADST
jgi:heptosyltransferase-2